MLSVMESFLLLKMRVIIFNDKDNFDGSLNLINKNLEKGRKRFWRIEKCHNYTFKKLTETFNIKPEEFKLIRSYIYTGEYTSQLLKKHKKYCEKETEHLDELIKKEEELINKINENCKNCNVEDKIKKVLGKHVNVIKDIYNREKIRLGRSIQKQKNNSEGQKKFFEYVKNMPFTECRSTPLKHGKGVIFQKGVDVKIATDLIHLANVNAYDIALILGGDMDLIESIKLVKNALGKIIVLVAYYDYDDIRNCSISKELIDCSDVFINLKDFDMKDIEEVSELRRVKELEEN
jgi:uncharacterized LabA/DUF88 family protein